MKKKKKEKKKYARAGLFQSENIENHTINFCDEFEVLTALYLSIAFHKAQGNLRLDSRDD